MERYQWILDKLPYTKPFLFVDEICTIDESQVTGTYTFDSNADFYRGHFKNNPITPGVILTECCAQIGLVCLGIYLLGETVDADKLKIGMSSSQMEFLLPVLPGTKVKVEAQLHYFRFQKLKCNVKMYTSDRKLICKGTLAGMIAKSNE